MNIVACQFDIIWENKPANFAKVRQMLAKASVQPGSLIVLPEMFATGFSMNVARVVEPPQAETSQFLAALAQEFASYVVAGVAIIGDETKGRNEALVFDPVGNEVARYLKQQPFTLGGERDHYLAGEQHVNFAWQGFTVSPFVCYDLRFPELFRTAVVAGANVLVVIANWPQSRATHWLALLQARAIENQAYVVGVNRCGDDPRLKYRGQSIIVDPQGNKLAEAGDAECVLTATLDLTALQDYRRKFPVLADMKLPS